MRIFPWDIVYNFPVCSSVIKSFFSIILHESFRLSSLATLFLSFSMNRADVYNPSLNWASFSNFTVSTPFSWGITFRNLIYLPLLFPLIFLTVQLRIYSSLLSLVNTPFYGILIPSIHVIFSFHLQIWNVSLLLFVISSFFIFA